MHVVNQMHAKHGDGKPYYRGSLTTPPHATCKALSAVASKTERPSGAYFSKC